LDATIEREIGPPVDRTIDPADATEVRQAFAFGFYLPYSPFARAPSAPWA